MTGPSHKVLDFLQDLPLRLLTTQLDMASTFGLLLALSLYDSIILVLNPSSTIS